MTTFIRSMDFAAYPPGDPVAWTLSNPANFQIFDLNGVRAVGAVTQFPQSMTLQDTDTDTLGSAWTTLPISGDYFKFTVDVVAYRRWNPTYAQKEIIQWSVRNNSTYSYSPGFKISYYTPTTDTVGHYFLYNCVDFNEGTDSNTKDITDLLLAQAVSRIEIILNNSTQVMYCKINNTFVDFLTYNAIAALSAPDVLRLDTDGVNTPATYWTNLRTKFLKYESAETVTTNSYTDSIGSFSDAAADLDTLAENSPRGSLLNTGKFRTGQFIGKRLE